MGLTNFPNGISSFGIPVVGGAQMPLTGTHFFVDYVNGSDGNNGKSPDKPFKTLFKAYSACTAGKNDVVFLMSNGQATGSHRLDPDTDGALTWAKDSTHLIGIAAPTKVSGRARVAWLSTTTKAATLLPVSADGCIFANVALFQDYGTAGANTCIAMTGERNYFYNCHIAGGGDATGGAHASCTSLTLAGDGENTFEDCTIGLDTISSGATAAATIALSSAAVRNHFIRCRIIKFAGDATSLFVTANASGALDRYNLFEDCSFINAVASTATGMTAALAVHATAGGMIIVKGGVLIGATDWTAADNTNVYLIGYNMAGSGNLNTGIAHTTDVA